MNYEQFERNLARKAPLPAYAFVGPEEFFKREGIALLRRKVIGKGDPQLCLLQVNGDEAQPVDLFDDLRTRTFFGGSKLAVLHNADAFLANYGEALAGYLKKPSSTSVLALLAEKLDGRTAVAKALGEGIVECKRIYDRQLSGWLTQRAKHYGITVSPEAAAMLAEHIGADLMQLDLQLEKLATLVGENGRVSPEHVADVVGHDKLVDVFKLTDAVAEGLPGSALETLHRLLERGEAPEYVLGMLAWQFRRLRRARRLLDEGVARQQLAERLGVNPYFIEGIVRQARRLSPQGLIEKQRLLHRSDVALKSRGEADSGLRVTEELVVQLCK
jgi:DNA polymerase-3 subunit delta